MSSAGAATRSPNMLFLGFCESCAALHFFTAASIPADVL